jgi:hypothetical protein
MLLPGCRGCERNERRIEPLPKSDPQVEKQAAPPGDSPGDGWTSGERSLLGVVENVRLVAVHGASVDYRIDHECGPERDKFTLSGDFGCLSSPPILVEVKRISNLWSVFEVSERRGSTTRRYHVTSPEHPPGPGCEGCLAWPAGLTEGMLPDHEAGLKESAMSLAAFSIRFEWKVVANRPGRAAEWLRAPIVSGESRVVSVDGSPVSVNLCRSQLEAIAASGETAFAVGVRLSQCDWPAGAPDPPLEKLLWADLSLDAVKRQLDGLKSDVLPRDPGVTIKPAGAKGTMAPGQGVGSSRRRGAVARAIVRRVELPVSPPPPAPAPPRVPDLGSGRGDAAPGEDLASLVQKSLALPENAGFRDWVRLGERGHALAPTRPAMQDLKFGWPGERGVEVEAAVALDGARSGAIERHFGIPDAALPAVYLGGEDVRAALEDLARPLMHLHGFALEGETMVVDYDWVVDISVPVIAPLAQSVLSASASAGDRAVSDRDIVGSLARFVQSAVPYVPISPAAGRVDADGRIRCGLRTPAETVIAGGDCDSKSLLLATLIRSVAPQLPIAVVSCMGGDTPHMVLAVACERASEERSVRVDGVEHVLIETTGAFEIGTLPDDVVGLDPRGLRPSRGG